MRIETSVSARRAAAPENLIRQFVAHRCQCASHFGVQHKILRAAYVQWTDDYDLPVMTERRFCDVLSTLGYAERNTVTGRGWTGLRLL